MKTQAMPHDVERMLDSEGRETLMLIKTPDGWKSRHSHTSSRARRLASQ